MKFNIVRHWFAFLVIALQLSSYSSFAQSESLTPESNSFLDEVARVDSVFSDTTSTDTLMLTLQDVTVPNDLLGIELLDPQQVLSLIEDHQLTSFNGENDIIFLTNSTFTFEGTEYNKDYSYGVQWKTINNVFLAGTLYQNLSCIHIGEFGTIYNETLPQEIDLHNNYVVLYDQDNLIGIAAYNRSHFDPILNIAKYIYTPESGSKPLNIPNSSRKQDYLSVSPNPAKATVRIDFSLNATAIGKLAITDITGKLIKEFSMGIIEHNAKYSIKEDISKLSPGIYILSLSTSQVRKTIKFIVSE